MSKKHKKGKYKDFLPAPETDFFSPNISQTQWDAVIVDPISTLDDFIEEMATLGEEEYKYPSLPSGQHMDTAPSAEKAEPAAQNSSRKNKAFSEYEVAKFIVDNYPTGLFQDIPYVKINGVHLPLTDRLIGKLIERSLDYNDKKPIPSKSFNSIYDWLCVLLDTEDHALQRSPRMILFDNGAYDFISGKMVYPQDNNFFPVRINASYSPDRAPETPAFDRFLRDCSYGDPEVKHLILAFLGYMISPVPGKHIIVMGPAPDSGKSLLGNFTRDLLGRKNTCAISLHKMSNSFEMAQLLGKSANFCLDISGAVLNENTVATLKRLTGSDPETINAKYKQPFPYENFAKMVFACNEGGLRLRTPDKGFANRLVVIPFTKSVAPADIDPDLPAKLWAERDGIVYHAVEALKKLHASKYRFPYCREAMLLKERWLKCADTSIQQFLDDVCILSEEERIWTSTLYAAYVAYCKNNSFSPVTENAFSRFIRSVPGISPAKWQENHTQLRGINGVCLKPNTPAF